MTRNQYPTHYRVKATGEVMQAVGRHGSTGAPEYRSTSDDLNLWVVSLLDGTTGEIRTYTLESLEPIES